MLTLLLTVHHITAATFFILSESGKCWGNADVSRQEKRHKRPFVVLDELSAGLKALVMASLRFHNDNTV